MGEAKARVSATEYLMWRKRFEDEPNAFHREDWFLARVCYEIYLIRKCLVGGGKQDLKMEDYLFKFEAAKTEQPETQVPITDLPVEEYESLRDKVSREAAAGWFAFLGMTEDGQYVRPPDRSAAADARTLAPKLAAPARPPEPVREKESAPPEPVRGSRVMKSSEQK